MEIWKYIGGFENYQVSSIGRVKKIENDKECREKILKLSKNYGYLQVCLHKDGKPYTRRVHRLVATAFIENPDSKETVNHKNGIRDDNQVENLEWATIKENTIHKFQVLGYVNSQTQRNRSSECNSKKVSSIDEFGKIVEYKSTLEAEKLTGVSNSSISQVCNGKRKKAGGFIWKYKL